LAGSSIAIYVDGETRRRIEARDSTHSRGQVGVRAFRCDADFDDVVFLPDFPFRRGDANSDAILDLSDAIFTLASLFSGGPAPACEDAADSNDDGTLDISDAI